MKPFSAHKQILATYRPQDVAPIPNTSRTPSTCDIRIGEFDELALGELLVLKARLAAHDVFSCL